MTSFVPNVKRAQKESLFFREIAQLFMQASQDDTRLKDIMIHRVQLSPDKGVCTVYFYTDQGEEQFKKILNVLVLYKPSLRKALAARIRSRYTPELIFKFDAQFEKELRIDQLLEEEKKRSEPS